MAGEKVVDVIPVALRISVEVLFIRAVDGAISKVVTSDYPTLKQEYILEDPQDNAGRVRSAIGRDISYFLTTINTQNDIMRRVVEKRGFTDG